jgi:hypothetical protein
MKWKVKINACGTVEDLKTLFTWTEDAEGNITRPLVEFPRGTINDFPYLRWEWCSRNLCK